MQSTVDKINFDIETKKIGLITGISNEIYFCSISHVSTVYLELINDNWVAWRETYQPNTNQLKHYKLIANGEFDYVLSRTKNYLNYITKNRSNP